MLACYKTDLYTGHYWVELYILCLPKAEFCSSHVRRKRHKNVVCSTVAQPGLQGSDRSVHSFILSMFLIMSLLHSYNRHV